MLTVLIIGFSIYLFIGVLLNILLHLNNDVHLTKIEHVMIFLIILLGWPLMLYAFASKILES